MQNLVSIEVGRAECSGAILRHLYSVLRPSANGIFIRAITRGTGRTRQRSKHARKSTDCLTNQLLLNIFRQEALFWTVLRIPVLITDPRHSPVDIRRAGLP